MKKLESLNKNKFKSFEKNEIAGLNKVLGGNIPTCTTDNCYDERTGNVSDPLSADEKVVITDKDCK